MNELLTLHFLTYARVYKKAVGYNCGDYVAAEDILQDAYVKAIENFESYTGSGEVSEFNKWFYSVCQNAMIDYYRKEEIRRNANLRFAEDELLKEYDIEENALRLVILEREIECKVVYDRIALGLPFSDISIRQDISPSAARKRVERFKNSLGDKYLEGDEE